MNLRRATSLAAVTTVLAGVSLYGTTTAFAATPTPDPKSSSSQVADTAPADDRDDAEAMMRHCTDRLPVAHRAQARQHMKKMMAGSMMDQPMMSGGNAHHGMG